MSIAGLGGVVAVVVTHRRPRLATDVVETLIQAEGFDPRAITLVVNGEGGLLDSRLESAINCVRLRYNLGPAGGFAEGLKAASAAGARWAYLCEDDIGLFDLPTPRVANLLHRLHQDADADAIAGIAAYGRVLDRRTGLTKPYVPFDPAAIPFPQVDVAAWGASLVRCDVLGNGVQPDPRLFFGFEDFDFWLALQRAGYRLVLDAHTAATISERVSNDQRSLLRDQRPVDDEEPWRRYYEARNFMELRRRYGRSTWTLAHVVKTARRVQVSPSRAHRSAALHGLWDGLLGRLGSNPRYQRTEGERAEAAEEGMSVASKRARSGTTSADSIPVLQVITDNDRRGGQVFAADLHEALARYGLHVRTVALAPAASGAGLPFDALGPSRWHPATLRNLRREIRRSRVVIGHGSTTLPTCVLAGFGVPVPFVYRQISDQLFWAHTPLRRLRVRSALRRVDCVTTLWSGAAQVTTEIFGVPDGRVTVIPNGVPAERCPEIDNEARRAARDRFGLDPDRPTLLSIGALVPEKGVDTAIRSMGDERASGWQLLVVGAGPELDRLQHLASLFRDRSIVFHPPVPTGTDAMAAADVVLLTSRGGDSMPAVLIEAGLMGLPTVATPVQGIAEVVCHRETGELVPIDDPPATTAAVARCLDRADDYGAAARAWCLRRFEMEPVAARWHELVETLAIPHA